MTKKTNFLGRIVFSTAILLTAMWLPLTALALESSETSGLLHDSIGRANNCEFDEEVVGFGETDPANSIFRDAVTSLRVPEILDQQTYVGFGETDPASQLLNDSKLALQAANTRATQVASNRSLQAIEGFAESDPAAIFRQEDNQIINRLFVTCNGERSSGVALEMSSFSGLTGRESRDEFELTSQVSWRN